MKKSALLIIILLVLLIAVLIFIFGDKERFRMSLPSLDPIGDFPSANPFEDTKMNPIEDIYKNPFE